MYCMSPDANHMDGDAQIDRSIWMGLPLQIPALDFVSMIADKGDRRAYVDMENRK